MSLHEKVSSVAPRRCYVINSDIIVYIIVFSHLGCSKTVMASIIHAKPLQMFRNRPVEKSALTSKRGLNTVKLP